MKVTGANGNMIAGNVTVIRSNMKVIGGNGNMTAGNSRLQETEGR